MYLSEWIYRPNETKLKEMITVSMSINELWKKHGATDTYLCTLNGSDMGCIPSTIAFENAEAFGKSSDAISANPDAGKNRQNSRVLVANGFGITWIEASAGLSFRAKDLVKRLG